MASGSDSIGWSNLHPDFIAGWCTDQDTPQHDPDFFVPGDASLFREAFEHPFPLFPSGFHPNFPFGAQQGTSPWQAVGQHNIPSPSDVPGPSNFQPLAAIPVSNSMGDCDSHRKGLWVTAGIHSSIAIPAIPPTLSLPSAATFPPDWVMIPQREYSRGQKQWSFKRHEPVSFSELGFPGVNMGTALRKTLENLDGRDDPVLQGASGAISCRFLFPGYPSNAGVFQIHALNWTKDRRPVKRGKLAYEIAKRLKRYLHSMAKFTPDESVETRWKIGQGCMHIDNMYLIRLTSVSKGSFQPEIWVADPLMPHVQLGWD